MSNSMDTTDLGVSECDVVWYTWRKSRMVIHPCKIGGLLLKHFVIIPCPAAKVIETDPVNSAQFSSLDVISGQ
jgi:hypothetical protein